MLSGEIEHEIRAFQYELDEFVPRRVLEIE